MNIGYDAKRLFNNKTGLGSYSRNLVNCMNEFCPSESYHLYTPTIKLAEYKNEFRNLNQVSIHKSTAINKTMWRSYGISKELRKDKIDIYHGLTHELPRNIDIAQCGKVVTIHDLIFKRFPAYFPATDRAIYNLKWKHSIASSDKIIAISKHTKADMIEYYAVDPDKIEVIYNTCDPRFYSVDPKNESKPSSLDLPENYMLSVGSIEPRKNFGAIVKALALIPKSQRIDLVIVGGGKQKNKKKLLELIHSLGLEKIVHLRSDITNDQIVEVYQRAEFLVYPSHYEGHGLPITESLLCGTAVISSETSSMKEAGGPDCIYIDPDNIDSISSAIITLLDDGQLRKSTSIKGRIFALQTFDRQSIANQILNLYKNI
ncbi:MAG: glycosyltransferase involved in cell wall biosynthesis [Saprospiraceae bacterium]|jgi:glycosyltransferase involved in cell wall biosynthesis